jgi:cytochrome c oxidase subunit III
MSTSYTSARPEVHAPGQDRAHDHGYELPYHTQVQANRLGLWLFFISEIFLFGALLIARFYLWGNTRPELSQELGLITTTILLASSYFVFRGETAIAYGDRKTFSTSFLIAALLGLIFFVGVVVMEWNLFGVTFEWGGIEWFGHLKPTDGVYGGVFFMMTGLHALHVISGVGLLLAAWHWGRKGYYTPERRWGAEGVALYWHYVDVVWIFYYPALYLIGTAV